MTLISLTYCDAELLAICLPDDPDFDLLAFEVLYNWIMAQALLFPQILTRMAAHSPDN